MSEELFTLSSNDYESRCKDTFSRLWAERDFADVTLATDDDFQISVHRIVLGSCSSLFKRLFSNTTSGHSSTKTVKEFTTAKNSHPNAKTWINPAVRSSKGIHKMSPVMMT